MSEKDQNKNADEVVPNEEFENLSPLQATGRPVNDSATEYAETALASRGEAPKKNSKTASRRYRRGRWSQSGSSVPNCRS